MPRDHADTPAAIRMRRHRQRIKQGFRFRRIPLFGDWRDGLLELGLITEAEAADPSKIDAAIGDFADAALAAALAPDRYANGGSREPVLDGRPEENRDANSPDLSRPSPGRRRAR